MVLYGKGVTAECMHRHFHTSISEVVDSDDISRMDSIACEYIFLSLSPRHYKDVVQKVEQSITSPLTIVFAFDSPRIILLETTPKSGTHYTADSLSGCLQFGLGTYFNEDIREKIKYRHTYLPQKHPQYGSLIWAHFFEPINDCVIREQAKIIFLFSYFFDFIYAWGRSIHDEASDEVCAYGEYRLQIESNEWMAISHHLYHMQKWLSYIVDSENFF